MAIDQSGRAAWRKQLWIVGALTGLLAAVGFISFARAHGPWGHARSPEEMQERMERHVEHLLDEVDASDAQRTQVDAIVDETAPKMYALSQEGRALREQIKQALLAQQVDKARIAAAHQELDGLATRLTDTALSGLTRVAEVLTPAQRKQVADKLAQFHR
jgi:Spy/CpxP family protein refolding chaperone